MAVPEVLVNGNHDQIRSWRRKTALAKTLRNRPDLLERVALTAVDKELLAQIKLDQIKLVQGTTDGDGASPVSTKDLSAKDHGKS
jgi:formate-dependent nitrite reductase cytochrome c552 subunit